MSERGDGGGNGDGGSGDKIDRSDLIDRLELVFDRATGALTIGGAVCNEEVILMMLYRAVNLYEFKTRSAFAVATVQAARDAQRVNDIMAAGRPRGRG